MRGDFGDSWKFTIPVTQKFSQVIWDSFWLAFTTLVLRVIIAIPLGILSARKQYSRTDYAITVFALIGISLPTFFFATHPQARFFRASWGGWICSARWGAIT